MTIIVAVALLMATAVVALAAQSPEATAALSAEGPFGAAGPTMQVALSFLPLALILAFLVYLVGSRK